MPTPDEEFLERLRATFKVEAAEYLQSMSGILLQLEKSPSSAPPPGAIETIFRDAHSLKGASRAVDFAEIEAVCQAMEGTFALWKRKALGPSPDAFDTLHAALNTIQGLLDETGSNDAAAKSGRDELIRKLNRLQAPTPDESSRDEHQPWEIAIAPAAPPVTEPGPATSPASALQPAPTPSPDTEKPEKPVVGNTVRIPIEKLDARLRQAEDMLAIKAMANERLTELRALTARFDQWRREWAKFSEESRSLRRTRSGDDSAGAESAPAFDPARLLGFLEWNSDYLRAMENRLVALAAQAEQDRYAVGRRVDDLLEDSKKLLMLPFSTMSELFPKLIRDLCRDQNKEANVVIRGGDVEMDKRILEEMKDALIHVLRNCVDHGIERPGDRERMGKPPRATITIAASQMDGNNFEILVSDDGAGVDVTRVKSSAIRNGVLTAASAEQLSERDAIALIFHSDVSTSPIVTTLSGRGLGMAIVRSKVEKLGGRLHLESKRNVGMTLRMSLPQTMATFRGMLVSSAEQTFIVPTANVHRVLRIKPADIRTVENRETITMEDRPVSLARLDNVLELPPAPARADATAPLSVMVMQSADQQIAFVVDEVMSEEEVLVKPLRKPLVRVRNLAGATVLGSGRAVPVLNVADLLLSARVRANVSAARPADPSKRKAAAKTLLVVEDSVTSRTLLKGILESAGYTVKTAVDGVEAFTVLRENDISLVVSDVEMPRMNGFDLTGRIRADKRLSELPVVLVTALESRAERERGVDAGANAYLIKNRFDQSDLLEVVQRLI